jgi:hypothetical protein
MAATMRQITQFFDITNGASAGRVHGMGLLGVARTGDRTLPQFTVFLR